MAVRDIQHLLAATIGTDLLDAISKITDGTLAAVLARQRRPLKALCPVIVALVVKGCDGAHVRN